MAFPASTSTGPTDTDPITDEELSILLAVPRAARTTPSATRYRLPRGSDSTLGWVDVACAQVESVVACLALRWNLMLSDIMHKRTGGEKSSVGPGTVVCILVQPPVNALFRRLAFLSLGCTVRYIMTSLDKHIVSSCLQQSGCHVVLCSGQDLCTKELVERLGIDVVALSDDESVISLATKELNS
ncbi:hypothetical protein BDV93DRAFT_563762 [Ceratobasidium sp. AG-I]|nr:hypothetical protein BDV93DRAFT_563762 [Ceratobasidium sp. AG-I]